MGITTKQWTVERKKGHDALEFHEQVQIPGLGDHDILVKIHAASLNYRDLVIADGSYPHPIRDGVVPGSDGAGTVEATGSKVARFKAGDRVVTLYNQGHIYGRLTPSAAATGLGGSKDGCFRQYGVFDENGLVAMPKNLNFQEAATLSCAALTAWNGLYGLQGRTIMPGDVVLTQGTGGVSLFALQFAKAAGATVIATTSSDAKAETLKKLGADHIINYKADPNWGETAKGLTSGKEGVDNVMEVGGPKTLAQSLKAVKLEGLVTIIGYLQGQVSNLPAELERGMKRCILRGIMVGSRQQFEQMNKAIETNDIHPVIDKKAFSLEQLKEAFEYQRDQQNFGKVVIMIEHEGTTIPKL